MLHILSEELKSQEIEELISICKSDSGKMGTELRTAHYKLGKLLSATYSADLGTDICIVSFMRAGLPFSFGIADAIDCSVTFYDDKRDEDFFAKNKALFESKNILFADSVINSGKGVLAAIEKSALPKERIKIATNVLCSKAIEKLSPFDVYAVRISQNSFTGAKAAMQKDGIGPDTGDRLFRTM